MQDLRLALKKIKVNIYFTVFFILCLIAGFFQEMMILFLFVMLHEISHVITAHVYKLTIENIEFFPFGGVASIDGLDSAEPMKQIIISAAGPLFNIAAGLGAFIIYKASGRGDFLVHIIKVNLQLALFNLIPGLPLDGGRIIRAFLTNIIGFRRATRYAVLSGKIISGAIFAYGVGTAIYGYINLSFIVVPIFIFISASKEEQILMYTIMKNVINKKNDIKGKGIMEAHEICVYGDVKAREVLKHFDVNKYHIIIVINTGMQVEGILTEYQLMEALSIHEGDITMCEICRLYK